MNPSRRPLLWSLTVMFSAVAGIGCDRGSQNIITIRRSTSFPASPQPGKTVKPPVPRSIDRSNGVDVPMIQVP